MTNGIQNIPVFQMLLVMVAFFLVVPALYCKIVLKEPLHNMGWQSGNVFSGVFLSLLALSLGLVIMYGLDRYTSFGSAYRLPQSIQTDFLWFLLYEALMAPLVVLFFFHISCLTRKFMYAGAME
jgi:hypothetical protein